MTSAEIVMAMSARNRVVAMWENWSICNPLDLHWVDIPAADTEILETLIRFLEMRPGCEWIYRTDNPMRRYESWWIVQVGFKRDTDAAMLKLMLP